MFMTPNLRNALAQQQGNKVAPSTTGATASPAPTTVMAPQQPTKTYEQFGADLSPGPTVGPQQAPSGVLGSIFGGGGGGTNPYGGGGPARGAGGSFGAMFGAPGSSGAPAGRSYGGGLFSSLFGSGGFGSLKDALFRSRMGERGPGRFRRGERGGLY